MKAQIQALFRYNTHTNTVCTPNKKGLQQAIQRHWSTASCKHNKHLWQVSFIDPPGSLSVAIPEPKTPL